MKLSTDPSVQEGLFVRNGQDAQPLAAWLEARRSIVTVVDGEPVVEEATLEPADGAAVPQGV